MAATKTAPEKRPGRVPMTEQEKAERAAKRAQMTPAEIKQEKVDAAWKALAKAKATLEKREASLKPSRDAVKLAEYRLKVAQMLPLLGIEESEDDTADAGPNDPFLSEDSDTDDGAVWATVEGEPAEAEGVNA